MSYDCPCAWYPTDDDFRRAAIYGDWGAKEAANQKILSDKIVIGVDPADDTRSVSVFQAFGISPDQFGEVSTVSSHKGTTLTMEHLKEAMTEMNKWDEERAALGAKLDQVIGQEMRDIFMGKWEACFPPLRLNESSSPHWEKSPIPDLGTYGQKSTSDFERWLANLPEWEYDNAADYSYVNFSGIELPDDQITAELHNANGQFPFHTSIILNRMDEGVIQIDYERDLMNILNGVFMVTGYDRGSETIVAEWDGD